MARGDKKGGETLLLRRVWGSTARVAEHGAFTVGLGRLAETLTAALHDWYCALGTLLLVRCIKEHNIMKSIWEWSQVFPTVTTHPLAMCMVVACITMRPYRRCEPFPHPRQVFTPGIPGTTP